MSLTLCVLLWARDGCELELADYEDRVLELIPEYGGRVLQRARTEGAGEEPLEIHTLEFPDEDALLDYMSDERRTALGPERDRVIAHTQLLRVDLV
jgi:uncharacterized protein (DUF1330 family)